ncbi:S46 family peptidase [Singulisphaera sp. Ch08]|uniref:Dipeptidyl-peptidase n=1 Tax=Singulisphaera sp. Ch08 TaxID=3120278 RepID=A0AAU7CEZ3_9BACT
MSARQRILALSVISVLSVGGTVTADEGMWVFNNLPLKALKQRYNFEPNPAWVERLRSSAVRFNSGGSGSFVSADGLVMTNHHVGADMLHKISTAGKDYLKEGFLAKTRAEEIKAPDLELNVLVDLQDVTDRVLAAVKPGMGDSEAGAAKRKAMATIEKESLDKSGLRSDVVTLYQGGQYALYTYKKYTDVRLVFAPEFEIAFFGGDPDNFEFPRYDLDVCFFRAYENDKPAQPKHYLNWSPAGSKDGDLIFVAGHPGKTSRLNTVAHLEYLRDVSFPFSLEILHAREAFLQEYGKKGPEQTRQAKDELFGYQNSRKAREGGLKGLKDESLMARKREAEQTLRTRIKADQAAQAAYGSAWDKIAASHQVATKIAKRFNMLERGFAFDSTLFQVARTLVRLAQEQEKPNGDRLREFRESAIESLQLALFSDAPIYPEFEEAKLAHSLTFWKNLMGDTDPMISRVLHGRTPEETAKELVRGTKLADVSLRRAIAKGGLKALLELDDPMIKLALAIDADARSLRTQYEDEVEDVLSAQYAGIAKAAFEAQGDSVYPDATFTLRLAFGTVKGYEARGKHVPPYTTIGGAFKHADAHGNTPPYVIPPSWHQAKKDGRLSLDTAMNFVSTADIIGGNSGSPVVNRDNEVVGLIFDGNVDSLVLDFAYDDQSARAISVDSRAIIEALKSVYRADDLVGELMRQR